MTPEERIQAALRRRDVDTALDAVMKGYGAQILGYLRAVVRDPEDAADVFSQFAEDVWKGLGSFRGECSARVWCYKIAYHAASRFGRDPFRRRRDRLGTSMASRLAQSILSSADHELNRRSVDLDELRRHLSAEDQTLLTLRIDRRLSWREVAEILAASEDGEGPVDEAALRKRFERLKEKLERLARDRGLLGGRRDRED